MTGEPRERRFRIPRSLQNSLIVVAVGLTMIAGAASPRSAPHVKPEGARHFETQIAPIVARHCLECHDPISKQGGLDLSRRETALAGGRSGTALVPGKAAESLLWRFVEVGAMPPQGRPRLSSQEKQRLRQWIDAGAIWSEKAIALPALPRDPRAADNWVQRLTLPEYIETVRSAVGVSVEEEARRILPPDLRADGFSNTAYNLHTDLGHVEAYARLAAIIVDRMDAGAFAARYTSRRELTDANMRRLISGMGKWVLRGPLQEGEIRSFLRVSHAIAREGGDFTGAAAGILEAMLQSPRFIYRLEAQRGDGSARRAGDHELASRLSYILWGGPPDRELMRAADAGELSDRSRVAAQVARMLRDPRAVRRSLQFVHDWLDLDRLSHLRPAQDRFPTWDSQLASDMGDETLAFFEEIAWKQRRPLSDLMNAHVTFLTPRLADHYGLRPRLDTGGRDEALQALYTFQEGSGDAIRDSSGVGEPLDLKIEDASAVRWEKGSLAVNGPTLIASARPPKRLIEAIRQSKALTLEAWIKPGVGRQSGPARIVTLSSGAGERNFTLGQEDDRFEVRLRTGRTNANGLPGLGSAGGSAGTRLTHVVYTREADGKAKLTINGEEAGARLTFGDLSNWNDGFRLALANETTKDRAWRGRYYRVAIYSRALTPEEIRSRSRRRARYDLSAVNGRGGLLTQGSVLTIGGEEASTVARGLFVLHDLLDSSVGSAPPGVDTTPVPTKPGLSQRAIAETRLADSSCGGCHSKFEPFAFGLERFDGVGAYQTVDRHGNALREDGTILFPGEDRPVSYASTRELMDLLAGSERVRETITRKATQFALGRPLAPADAPMLEKIHAAAEKGGGTFPSLMTAIVMSDLVQKTRTEKIP